MPYKVSIDEFPPVIREFASYKTAIQGCSQKTVDEYLLDLRTFFRYLIAKEHAIDPDSDEFCEISIVNVDVAYIKEITPDKIYDFLLYTGNVRKNMWASKARKLSAIKGLFKFMTVKRGYLTENPAANIESPKRKKTLPKFLSLEESKMLLDTVRNDTQSKSRLRDLCIITLFLNCGMRLNELVGISLSDIDRELNHIRVVGKGSKERIIYLNEACKVVLSDYLLNYRLIEKNRNITDKALFLSNRDKRISDKMVQAMVYKYLDLSGLGSKHYSVHKLRHTAATLMYQSGNVDIRVLKDILGHEQLNTTQIYTHVSDKNMMNAMAQNPLADITETKADKSPSDTEE
ncbi:MAG: tyrosine-type recombinase/integrase [Clostridia bacterium]|nr:tyrosine-type recombinase/integrase [Clostridia bacterium]